VKLITVTRELFSIAEITIFFILLIIFNFFYQYFLSKNVTSAILLGIFGGIVLFFSIILKNRKTLNFQMQLNQLNKYASCVVFKLKTSQNVIYSVKGVIELLDGQIKKDVLLLIDHLEKYQEIRSDQFLKYNFPAINVFHQILEIQYYYGGRANELFNQILKDIAFELKKRDELYRKKALISMQIYLMTAIVASIPILLKILASEIYKSFISMVSSQIIIMIFHLLLIIHIHFLQKTKSDITIRV
jgi:Flp pilus assembly protein TadB